MGGYNTASEMLNKKNIVFVTFLFMWVGESHPHSSAKHKAQYAGIVNCKPLYCLPLHLKVAQFC